MFTGIIETMGAVTKVGSKGDYKLISLRPEKPFEGISEGESIAVDGCCLTVTNFGKADFTLEASPESVRLTIIKGYKAGTNVNLERAVTPQGRMGGHFVSGHVDTAGKMSRVKKTGNVMEAEVQYPAEFADYVVEKGSIAVNGVSLTINQIREGLFTVNVIPFTREATTLDALKTGDIVNLEFDMIGKYVAKMLKRERSKSLTIEKLVESGW